MSRRTYLLVAAAAAALLVLLVVFRSHDAPYTARVVDAATGQPVEGAIYLAVWWKTSVNKEKPWWEGTATVIDRFVEGQTGPDGVIRVPGFWRRRIASQQNTLTVYKPGYVLWFQEKIFPKYADRTDFDRDHRTVRLVRWDDSMSGVNMCNFSITATKGDLINPIYMRGNRKMSRALQNFENEYMRKGRVKH